MKPYFAKYLPVEGKVEIGDYFIDTGVMSNGTLVGKRGNKEGVYDYQKVKLFLCSRDIQIGDKVIHPEFGERIVISDKDYKNPSKMKVFRKLGNWCHINAAREFHFKAIGEISPDALYYVKEGDEFDEEDVTPQYYEHDPKQDLMFMRVKGPCGHFH